MQNCLAWRTVQWSWVRKKRDHMSLSSVIIVCQHRQPASAASTGSQHRQPGRDRMSSSSVIIVCQHRKPASAASIGSQHQQPASTASTSSSSHSRDLICSHFGAITDRGQGRRLSTAPAWHRRLPQTNEHVEEPQDLVEGLLVSLAQSGDVLEQEAPWLGVRQVFDDVHRDASS